MPDGAVESLPKTPSTPIEQLGEQLTPTPSDYEPDLCFTPGFLVLQPHIGHRSFLGGGGALTFGVVVVGVREILRRSGRCASFGPHNAICGGRVKVRWECVSR